MLKHEGRIAHALTKTSSEDGRFRKLAQHHQAAGHVAHRALNGDHTHCPFTTARRPWWRDVKLLRNVALDLRPWSSRFVYISLSRTTVWGKRDVSCCFVLTIFSLEHHKDRKSNVLSSGSGKVEAFHDCILPRSHGISSHVVFVDNTVKHFYSFFLLIYNSTSYLWC